jgi:type III secretory pathway component EscV
MSNVITNIKKNYKTILLLVVFLVCLPLITTLVDIIFTYGTYVGSYARLIIDKGFCM